MITNLSPALNVEFGLSQDVSADGNKVAFATSNGIDFDGYKLYVLDRISGERVLYGEHLRAPYLDGPIPMKFAQGGQALFFSVIEHPDNTSWFHPVYKLDFNSMEQINVGDGTFADVSADGNKVLFVRGHEVYLRNIQFGDEDPGAQSYGQVIGLPSISGDGNCIAFSSSAALDPADSNGMWDIYLEDLRNDSLRRVSISSEGVQSNGYSMGPKFGDDCDSLLFATSATNLAVGVPESSVALIKLNLISGAYELITDSVAQFCDDGGCSPAKYSMRGANIIFESNGGIFVKNPASEEALRINAVDSQGSQYSPSISENGQVAVFNAALIAPSTWNDSFLALIPEAVIAPPTPTPTSIPTPQPTPTIAPPAPFGPLHVPLSPQVSERIRGRATVFTVTMSEAPAGVRSLRREIRYRISGGRWVTKRMANSRTSLTIRAGRNASIEVRGRLSALPAGARIRAFTQWSAAAVL